MENVVKDLSTKIDMLFKCLEQVQFYLNLTWTLLGIIIAVIAFIGAILLKTWVNTEVNNRVKNIVEDIEELKKSNNKLRERMDKMIISDGGNYGGYIHFEDGTQICYLKPMVGINTPVPTPLTFTFPTSFDDNERIFPTVSILNNKNANVSIESVTNGSITILLSGSDLSKGVEISIIAIGKFKKITDKSI